MKIINQDIKSGEYKPVYLIYGTEDYLKKQYRDKLRAAIIGDDTMNYTYFEGKQISVNLIVDTAQTMPFFADRRLIVIENSGFFKTSNDELADLIKNIPDYLVIVFVESEIDKKYKLYKAVNEKGYVAEMKPQTTATLKKWIAVLASSEKKKITNEAADLLLDRTGATMNLIKTEFEKIVCFCGEKEIISREDVDEVCVTLTENRIFDMISAMASKKQEIALQLYYDMLELNESPIKILVLISRQFNGILQVKEQMKKGNTNAQIASKMGIKPFIVGKYAQQAGLFDENQLRQALRDCAASDEDIKTGKISDRLAVELLIIKYSGK